MNDNHLKNNFLSPSPKIENDTFSPIPQKSQAIKIQPNTMSFPDALKEVIKGKKITRLEWQDQQINHYGFLNEQWLSLHKEDGKNYKWIINDGDLLSEDWIIFELH